MVHASVASARAQLAARPVYSQVLRIKNETRPGACTDFLKGPARPTSDPGAPFLAHFARSGTTLNCLGPTLRELQPSPPGPRHAAPDPVWPEEAHAARPVPDKLRHTV